MPKKPTGKLGPIESSSSGVELKSIQWSGDKTEIEQKIADMMWQRSQTAAAEGIRFSNLVIDERPESNHENDHDFTILSEGRQKTLELTEYAPRQQMSRGGYQAAERAFIVMDCVNWLLDTIRNKTTHYPDGATCSLVLALYVTDGAFSTQAIAAVR